MGVFGIGLSYWFDLDNDKYRYYSTGEIMDDNPMYSTGIMPNAYIIYLFN